MIGNKRSRTEKADIVCKLIQLFGIGCIIFDEIQLINFNCNKENTYEGDCKMNDIFDMERIFTLFIYEKLKDILLYFYNINLN